MTTYRTPRRLKRWITARYGSWIGVRVIVRAWRLGNGASRRVGRHAPSPAPCRQASRPLVPQGVDSRALEETRRPRPAGRRTASRLGCSRAAPPRWPTPASRPPAARHPWRTGWNGSLQAGGPAQPPPSPAPPPPNREGGGGGKRG